MSKYAFGDIAINSTEKKKPEPADKATYIGLEHLDSGSLIVRRFGSDVAPIGDKLIMKKGDILFGKRRAYQKKVAIAPFDGIFSAHGMVLRPKTEVIDKDFFPLFIASDYFLDAAIRISVGSLSPTINWSDLKALEFSLPPLDEQRRLAQLLWAALDLKEAYQTMLARCDEMASSRFIEMFGNPIEHENNNGFPLLGKICNLKAGAFIKADEIHEQYSEGLFPCYGGNGCRGYVASFTHEGEFPIIGRQGALCGNVQFATGKFHATEHAVVVTPLTKIDSYWLYNLLGRLELKRYATGGAQPGLAVNRLEKIHVKVPDSSSEADFVRFVHQLDKSKVALQKNIERLDILIKTLLQEHLG